MLNQPMVVPGPVDTALARVLHRLRDAGPNRSGPPARPGAGGGLEPVPRRGARTAGDGLRLRHRGAEHVAEPGHRLRRSRIAWRRRWNAARHPAETGLSIQLVMRTLRNSTSRDSSGKGIAGSGGWARVAGRLLICGDSSIARQQLCWLHAESPRPATPPRGLRGLPAL